MPSDELPPRICAPPWAHRRGWLSLARPQVMAILNVTPDSFSDGGAYFVDGRVCVQAAAEAARRALGCGAVLIDIGGESTRPGAEPVAVAEELARVLEVVRAVAELPAAIVSIDTRRADVASEAIARGAAIINDVSGLADPAMAAVAARTGAGLVIGHLRGEPKTMQDTVEFGDLQHEIAGELTGAVERALAAGVERARIVVDPGVGFGKSPVQSAALVGAATWLEPATGCPVMIGASRKSFLAAVPGGAPKGPLAASLAAAVIAVERGASIIRAHDVPETIDALAVAAAIREAATATTAVPESARTGSL